MFAYETQRHVTHLLLIDREPVLTVQALMRNATELYLEFCKIARSSTYSRYTLALVFPESRRDLGGLAAELNAQMEKLGVTLRVHAVPDAEMCLVKGKAGLLASSLWLIAGAALVNDKTIAPENAASILTLANRSGGIYPLGDGLHAALIGSVTSIDYSLLRLPDNHDLSDVLQVLGGAHRLSASEPRGKRK